MKSKLIVLTIISLCLTASKALQANTFLPFCEKDASYRHYCSGIYIFSNGKYDGDWVSNKPHGNGQFSFNTGEIYKGQFQNGKPHGKGVKTYSFNTKTLKGNWKKGVYVSNKAPANSYTEGSSWKCKSGFSRVGNICSKNKNRSSSSSSSSCKKNGYIKSGNRCVKAYVPENAKWVYNHWRCNQGFIKSGTSCIKLNGIPANSHRGTSGRWACNTNYEKLGDACISIKNVANSFKSGGTWYCKKGYLKSEISGGSCIKYCKKGYLKSEISGGSCIKEGLKTANNKKPSSGDLLKNIATILSIAGEAASIATEGLPSPTYNSVTPRFKSNSNSNNSSGYKSSYGNIYKYDLSKQSDRIKYQSDPAAKLLDSIGSQYIREMENNLGEFGGGIFQQNNSPSWDNNMWNNNSWNNNSLSF